MDTFALGIQALAVLLTPGRHRLQHHRALGREGLRPRHTTSPPTEGAPPPGYDSQARARRRPAHVRRPAQPLPADLRRPLRTRLRRQFAHRPRRSRDRPPSASKIPASRSASSSAPSASAPTARSPTSRRCCPHARYEHVVVNDSDILVSPHYLTRIHGRLRRPRRRPRHRPVPRPRRTQYLVQSRSPRHLHRLPARRPHGPPPRTRHPLRPRLPHWRPPRPRSKASAASPRSSTSSPTTTNSARALSRAGYRVELVREIVDTTVPAYTLRGLCEHQLRWARSTRADSRRAGYLGLGVTYVLPWALLAVVASGGALWSFSLLSLALLVRVGVALTVGVGILRDEQVLRDLWLLPLRDCFGLFFWAWSYASDEVVWRGETLPPQARRAGTGLAHLCTYWS